jgi:hypothetical protein
VVKASAAEVLIAQFCVTLADTGTEVLALAANVISDWDTKATATERHNTDFFNMTLLLN